MLNQSQFKTLQIINLISLASILFIVFFTYYNWSTLKFYQYASLIILALLLFYNLFRQFYNQNKQQYQYNGKIPRIGLSSKNSEKSFYDNLLMTASRIKHGSVSNQNKNWNKNIVYQGQRRTMGYQPMRYQSYGNHRDFQPNRNSFRQQNYGVNYNILRGESINKKIDHIKRISHPMIYLDQLIQKIRSSSDGQNQQNSRGRMTEYFNQLERNESLQVLNKHQIRLTKKSHITIKNIQLSGQIMAEYINTKIKQILNQVSKQYERLNNLTIKCFNLELTFQNYDQPENDSRLVSLYQLNKYRQNYKRNGFISNKYSLKVSSNQFCSKYFNQLDILTQNLYLFSCIINQKQLVSVFHIYFKVIQIIFNQDIFQVFRQNKNNDPAYKNKQVIYLYDTTSQIFFTYNKLPEFITSNPLLLFYAVFSYNFTDRKYQNLQIVKQLSRFFKEQIPTNLPNQPINRPYY